MRPIVLYNDPVLETPCEEVTVFDSELQELVDEMFEIMHEANGVGLAANQIGISKRIAVIDVGGDTSPIVLVNPYITASNGHHAASEGCLSLPGVTEIVDRKHSVTVVAQSASGEPYTIRGTWLLARALQHEIDHLNGKLCISEAGRQRFLESLGG